MQSQIVDKEETYENVTFFMIHDSFAIHSGIRQNTRISRA